MTQLNSLFFFYFVLLLLGCININDDDNPQEPDCWTPPSELPENDGLGEHVAFMRNDTAWLTGKSTNGIGEFLLSEGAVDLTYNLSEVSNSLIIQGRLDIEDECADILDRMLLVILDPVIGENDSISTSTYFSMTDESLGIGSRYRLVEDSIMKINILEFDLQQERATGTFEFDMINEDNDQDTLRIRNGRFEGNIL